MTQKKRPMCIYQADHREYYVQVMPVERMNCIGKNLGRSAITGANGAATLSLEISAFIILTMCSYMHQAFIM